MMRAAIYITGKNLLKNNNRGYNIGLSVVCNVHCTTTSKSPPRRWLISRASDNTNTNDNDNQHNDTPLRLTAEQAYQLAFKLNDDERKFMLDALQEYQSKKIKDEYEGQLAAHRWRSKFGRPSKVPKLGDVDPTGTYCPVPEDWLKKKYVETVPPPTTKELFHLMVANSIPFIGFGFLDNFIMIVAGDYIDHMLGAYICMSTMAAAALGNTFSDVIGIGSAYYVERFAEKIGFEPPKLSPMQLDMPISRRASNLGRVLGITIGCLLGMLPLLFMKEEPKPAVTLANGQTAPATASTTTTATVIATAAVVAAEADKKTVVEEKK